MEGLGRTSIRPFRCRTGGKTEPCPRPSSGKRRGRYTSTRSEAKPHHAKSSQTERRQTTPRLPERPARHTHEHTYTHEGPNRLTARVASGAGDHTGCFRHLGQQGQPPLPPPRGPAGRNRRRESGTIGPEPPLRHLSLEQGQSAVALPGTAARANRCTVCTSVICVRVCGANEGGGGGGDWLVKSALWVAVVRNSLRLVHSFCWDVPDCLPSPRQKTSKPLGVLGHQRPLPLFSGGQRNALLSTVLVNTATTFCPPGHRRDSKVKEHQLCLQEISGRVFYGLEIQGACQNRG